MTFNNAKNYSSNIGKEGVFLSLLFLSIFLFITSVTMTGFGYHYKMISKIIMLISELLFLISQILNLILLYQVWRFVIDKLEELKLEPSMYTPGQAVGRLFIPFYNFYWMFKAYGKFPDDLNLLAKTKNINRRMPPVIGKSIPVLSLIYALTYFIFKILSEIVNYPTTELTVIFSLIIIAFISIFFLNLVFICSAVNMCKSIDKEIIYETDVRINSFSKILNYKEYGINYYLGAGLFFGGILSFISFLIYNEEYNKLIFNISQGYTIRIEELQIYFIQFLEKLSFAIFIIIFLYKIKNDLILLIAFSVAYPVIKFILLDAVNLLQIPMNMMGPDLLLSFLDFISVFLFLGAILMVVRNYGFKMWYIILSGLFSGVITDVYRYIHFYYFLNMTQTELTSCIYSTFENPVQCLFICAGLYLFLKESGYKFSNGVLKKIEWN